MRTLKSLDRNQVYGIQTPQETTYYEPVSYQSLIEGADRLADQYQFVLNKEEFQTDIHGGVIKMKFFYDDGMSNKGYQLSVLTSNDKTLSVRASGGIYSHICLNLNMIGDIKLLHRHQGDVKEEIGTFLDACFASHQHNLILANSMESNFQLVPLTKREIAQIIGRAFVEEKIVSSTQLAIICKELENPSFNYDGKGTLWELYNHFTHAIKNEHPRSYMQTQQSVQNFFINAQTEYV